MRTSPSQIFLLNYAYQTPDLHANANFNMAPIAKFFFTQLCH